MSETTGTDERARELAERVTDRLARGEVSAARAALSRGWRDLVPALPTRFSLSLVNVDRRAVTEVLRRWKRSGKRPPLRMIEADEQLLIVTQRGKRLELGRLPSSEAKMLRELGSAARRFKPRLIHVSRNDAGEITDVTVELVRPQARICASCTRVHFDDHPNCASCRAKRRRRGPERFEHTPLAVQEAIEAVVAESAEDDPDAFNPAA